MKVSIGRNNLKVSFGLVVFGLDLMQNNLVLGQFWFSRFYKFKYRAMHEFCVSLRCYYGFRVKSSIWKGFRNMKPDLEKIWVEG